MIFNTNFSREYVEQLESILGSEWVYSATNIEDKVLYEIKCLQRAIVQKDIEISNWKRWLEYAEKKVAELEQERQWIPVSERLPEDNQRVLVLSDLGVEVAYRGRFYGMSHFDIKWLDFDGNPIMYILTHWQPLPQPPQEGE